MPTALDQHAPNLRLLVDLTVAALLADARLPADKRTRGVCGSGWGRCAYGNGVSNDDLARLTRARKHCLERIFAYALATVRRTVEEDHANAGAIRQRLVARRAKARGHLAAVLLAIEAALDLLWLEHKAKGSGPRLKLALCYSAFGDVAATVTGQAQELDRLFQRVPAELHIFAVAGMDDATAVPAEIDSVHIHFRRVDLSELVAFPGIKAPGLLGACAEAVRHGVDFVITIDGDGRLPLWETIPAIAGMVRSPAVDAALGSRRHRPGVIKSGGTRVGLKTQRTPQVRCSGP